MKVHARRLCAVLACALALVCAPRLAGAAGKGETDAKSALRKSVGDYQAGNFDAALARLEKALEGCGACSAATKAALLRDVGTMHLRKSERDAAANAFVEAIRLDANIDVNPAYDGPDVRAEWKASKDEASILGKSQPGGDFIHSPAEEQRVSTPLPVFVGYTGSAKIAKVMLKYKSPSARSYSALALSHRSGGWGGVIPCAYVERGVIRYYVEGFDDGGDPVASSGSAESPFFVPIRWHITGAAPSLPDAKPPKTCGENVAATPVAHDDVKPAPAAPDKPAAAVGESCDEDTDCESHSCSHGQCVGRHRVEAKAPPGSYARWWIGVSSSIDLVSLPNAADVCKLNASAVPANGSGYYCTNPRDNSDYPSRSVMSQNASLAPGNAGAPNGGFAAQDWRVLLTVDYALSSSFLLGARLGYVFGAYPGQAAVHDGHAFGTPIHAELRATYLFGDEPLADIGFAPYVFGGAGVSEFDAQTTVFVRQSNIVGSIPLQAWVTGGPFFAALGAGLRYAFSLRAAFLLGARGTLVFGGGGGILPTAAPELTFQYGF